MKKTQVIVAVEVHIKGFATAIVYGDGEMMDVGPVTLETTPIRGHIACPVSENAEEQKQITDHTKEMDANTIIARVAADVLREASIKTAAAAGMERAGVVKANVPGASA